MASPVLVWGSLAVVLVVLLSILGAVEERARLAFVGGIGLFVVVHVAAPGADAIGGLLALIGIVVAFVATVPLLRQPV